MSFSNSLRILFRFFVKKKYKFPVSSCRSPLQISIVVVVDGLIFLAANLLLLNIVVDLLQRANFYVLLLLLHHVFFLLPLPYISKLVSNTGLTYDFKIILIARCGETAQ